MSRSLAWFFLLILAVGILYAQNTTAPVAEQPNVAQQAVTTAMLEECKGAAKMRFQQAMVGQEIDVEGFRAICLKLKACRDKLFVAVKQ